MTSRIAADRLEGGRGNKVSSSSPIATPWKTYQVGYMTTQVLHLSWSLRPPNFPGRNLVGRLITFIVRTNGPARACSRHRSGSDLCSLVRAFAQALHVTTAASFIPSSRPLLRSFTGWQIGNTKLHLDTLLRIHQFNTSVFLLSRRFLSTGNFDTDMPAATASCHLIPESITTRGSSCRSFCLTGVFIFHNSDSGSLEVSVSSVALCTSLGRVHNGEG